VVLTNTDNNKQYWKNKLLINLNKPKQLIIQKLKLPRITDNLQSEPQLLFFTILMTTITREINYTKHF